MKWIFNFVVPLLDVMTRVTLLYEYLDGLTGAGEDSQHERCVVISVLLLQQCGDISICLVLLGANQMVENDVNNLMIPLLGGSVQDSLFLIIFAADVRSLFYKIGRSTFLAFQKSPTKQYLDDLLVTVGCGYLQGSALLVISHIQKDSFLAGETLHYPDVAPHGCVMERTKFVLVGLVEVSAVAQQSLHHQNTDIIRLSAPTDIPLCLVLAVPGGVVERRHLVRPDIVNNNPLVLQENLDDWQVAVSRSVVEGGVLLLVQPVEIVS